MEKRYLQRNLMESTLHYIQENYNEPLHLSDLADQVYMSPATFSRNFYTITGKHFSEYILELRLVHAEKDLKTTNYPLTEIAHANGFSSSSIFSKNFHQKYGMAPREYRQRYSLMNREEADEVSIRNIAVDTEKNHLFKNPCIQAFNLGEAHSLLYAKIQKQVQELHTMIPFKYLRLGSVFSDNLMLRQSHQTVHINYEHLDTVFDFLVENKIIPIIDISDKDNYLKKDIFEYLFGEPTAGVFDSAQEAGSIIHLIIKHFLQRYGAVEVNQWIFEFWYEDIIPGKNHPSEYLYVFEQVWLGIKSLLPDCQLGGGALLIGTRQWEFEKIIEGWKAGNRTPDFISINLYPYTREAGSDHPPLYTIDPHYSSNMLNYCHQILSQNQMDHVPLYVTEWNLSISERNSLNDTPAKAALMTRHLMDSLEQCQLLIYSRLTDLISNHIDSLTPLYGGSGLLSKDGLPKPTVWALHFLSKLQPYIITSREGCIITTDNYGSYTILCVNSGQLTDQYLTKKEYEIVPDDIPHLFAPIKPIKYNIQLNNTLFPTYAKTTQTISETSANLHHQLGQYASGRTIYPLLRPVDLKHLKQTSVPQSTTEIIHTQNNTLKLTLSLTPHQITLIQISPQ